MVECSKGLVGRSKDAETQDLTKTIEVVLKDGGRPFQTVSTTLTLRSDLPLCASNPTVNNLRDQLQANIEHRVRKKI